MYVLGNATIREVIKTLSAHNIHRVYVCNSHKQKEPIGIVNITGQQHDQAAEADSEARREACTQINSFSLDFRLRGHLSLCRSDVLLEILSN